MNERKLHEMKVAFEWALKFQKEGNKLFVEIASNQAKDVLALLAELDRMRGALEKVANCDEGGEMWDAPEMRKRARAALEQKEESEK